MAKMRRENADCERATSLERPSLPRIHQTTTRIVTSSTWTLLLTRFYSQKLHSSSRSWIIFVIIFGLENASSLLFWFNYLLQ